MLNDRYVFSQLIDSIPGHEFDRCVARYHGNRRARKFSTLIGHQVFSRKPP